MSPTPWRVTEWAWVLGAFALLTLGYAATQPVHPAEGLGGDGQAYHAMAKAMPRELPPADGSRAGRTRQGRAHQQQNGR